MRNLKRLTSVLLCILMLASVSCSQTDNTGTADTSETTAVQPPETEAAETEPVPALEARDFEGRTFSIMGERWSTYTPLDYVDIVVETQTGEALNDAAFNRNINMEELHNCKVTFRQMEGTLLSALQSEVFSGDGAYDVVLLRGTYSATAVTSGYLADMGELPHLDITRPWWYQDAFETLEVGGKNYVGMGYITTNHMNSVWTVCFNKQMIVDNQMDNPYTLVNEGNWTFDKAIEMSAAIAGDTNGDSVMNQEDTWGLHHTNDTIIGMLNSCGVQIANLKSGKMEVTINTPENIERMIDILTKLFNEDYAMDTLSRNHMKATDSDGQFFAEDKVLFLFTATHLIWKLRQMDVEFGMLPYPKYNEVEDYNSTAAGIFNTLVTVPASLTDADAVGYFLEAYSYEGWKALKPAYYDKVLQGKLARDEESRDMLDYIYSNLTYDAGNIYNIANLSSAVGSLSATLNTNIASWLAGQENVIQTDVDKFNEYAS